MIAERMFFYLFPIDSSIWIILEALVDEIKT